MMQSLATVVFFFKRSALFYQFKTDEPEISGPLGVSFTSEKTKLLQRRPLRVYTVIAPSSLKIASSDKLVLAAAANTHHRH